MKIYVKQEVSSMILHVIVDKLHRIKFCLLFSCNLEITLTHLNDLISSGSDLVGVLQQGNLQPMLDSSPTGLEIRVGVQGFLSRLRLC